MADRDLCRMRFQAQGGAGGGHFRKSCEK